jgi:hypothetical protein
MSSNLDSLIRPAGLENIDKYAPFTYKYDSATQQVAFYQRLEGEWISIPIDQTYPRQWFQVGIAVRPAQFIESSANVPFVSNLDEKVAHWGVYICDPSTNMVTSHETSNYQGTSC